MNTVIKVYYSPTNAQVVVLKTVLKFTLKLLQHVSVQSHHPQEVHYSTSEQCNIHTPTRVSPPNFDMINFFVQNLLLQYVTHSYSLQTY